MLATSKTCPRSPKSPVMRLTVSAKVITWMSPLAMWLTSWANTPASSRRLSRRRSPSESTMAASCRRPVAKAFMTRVGR